MPCFTNSARGCVCFPWRTDFGFGNQPMPFLGSGPAAGEIWTALTGRRIFVGRLFRC